MPTITDIADPKGRRKYSDDEEGSKNGGRSAKGEIVRPKLSLAGEEMKKYIKWLTYSKSKVSFGFQHLGPAYLPLMTEERHGYSLYFEKVTGWSLPTGIIKAFTTNETEDFEITVQLSLTMYQITTSTFFGSTWMGPLVSLGNSSRKMPTTIDFDYKDLVYMISRIIDPSCVAIVEVVVSKFDAQSNILLNQYG